MGTAMGTERYSVGVDLGTSSLKVVAIAADGTVGGAARREYPTVRSTPGMAEQDPALWLSGLAAALGELSDAVPSGSWSCVGLSGMLPTLVALDATASPVAPAITWQDGRAEPFGAALRRRMGEDEWYRRTGQVVDGRYLVPMMHALAERDPEAARRAEWIAGAKAFLFQRLTGELLTDPSTAAGFGCFDLADRAWIDGVIETHALPPVAPSVTVRPASAAAGDFGLPAGLPVVLGAADSVLGALAVGATEPGDVAYLAGSSTVVLGILDRRDGAQPRDDRRRYLVTPTAVGGLAAEMDLLATGSAIDWLAGLVRGDVRTLLADLPQPDLATGGPIFLPYLAGGEQGALWDASLSGSLVGLHLSHAPRDVARALVSGIVVESARCLDVLAEATGVRGEVRAAGSGLPRQMAQDLADASGRRVSVRSPAVSSSAYGAAILAAQAIGAPIAHRPRADVVAEPEAARAAGWAELAAAHDRVRNALRGAR